VLPVAWHPDILQVACIVGFTSAVKVLGTELQSSELPPSSLSLLQEKEMKTEKVSIASTGSILVIALGL